MARTQEVLPPSRLREKRRKVRTLKRVAWGMGAALLIAGLIGASYIRGIRIRDIVIEGTQSIAPEALQENVMRELSGKHWWVIPKDNVAVYSAATLQASLLKQFPKLKQATVSLETFHGLKISVEERTPVALWCGTAPQIDIGNEETCSFLDEQGYAYEPAPIYSDVVYVRWYGALDSTDIPAHYLESATFRSLRALVESFRTHEQTPDTITVDENSDVFASFAEGFQLRFILAQNPEDVIASLRTALESSALKGKKLSDVQYVDLRFGNRLYYKFK